MGGGLASGAVPASQFFSCERTRGRKDVACAPPSPGCAGPSDERKNGQAASPTRVPVFPHLPVLALSLLAKLIARGWPNSWRFPSLHRSISFRPPSVWLQRPCASVHHSSRLNANATFLLQTNCISDPSNAHFAHLRHQTLTPSAERRKHHTTLNHNQSIRRLSANRLLLH